MFISIEQLETAVAGIACDAIRHEMHLDACFGRLVALWQEEPAAAARAYVESYYAQYGDAVAVLAVNPSREGEGAFDVDYQLSGRHIEVFTVWLESSASAVPFVYGEF